MITESVSFKESKAGREISLKLSYVSVFIVVTWISS